MGVSVLLSTDIRKDTNKTHVKLSLNVMSPNGTMLYHLNNITGLLDQYTATAGNVVYAHRTDK